MNDELSKPAGSEASPGAAPTGDGAEAEMIFRRGRQDVGYRIARWAMLGVLVLMAIIFSAAVPDLFPTYGTLKMILSTQSVTVILAVAMVFPLVVGNFDLSVGYVCGFSALLVAGFTARWGELPIWLAVILALLAAEFIGLVNGILVTRIGINALISTMGMGTAIYGLMLSFTGGGTISQNIPQGVTKIGSTLIGGMPISVFYMIVIAVAAWYVLEKTPFGRYMYAVGGSSEAARLAGIDNKRLTLYSFLISAGLAGIAGVLTASRMGVGDPTVGGSFLLPVFAGALLGAAAIKPGTFQIAGTVVGVFTLAVGVTGLQQAGVAFWIEPMFNGLALIIAVALARYLQREAL